MNVHNQNLKDNKYYQKLSVGSLKYFETPDFYRMPESLENYDYFNSVVGTAPLDGDSRTYNRVIDTQTNKTYSVVSSTYTPINNAFFYGSLEKAISSVYSGVIDKTPFVYGSDNHTGVRSAMRYRLTDLGYAISQGTRDTSHPTTVTPELWAYNSYDTSQTARASFSLFDMACENGMATKQLIDFIKVKHTKNASLAINPERIQNGITLVKKQIDVIQQWANESINYAQAKELLLTLKGMVDNKTPDKLENSKHNNPADITFDHLLNNFESESVKRGGRTVWSLVSAVTDWSTLRSNNDTNKLHTSSLSAGVNRQERVANWISNHVMPTYSHLGAVA